MSQKIESLYIHWPFCPYKCYYCPFVAVAGHDEFMGRYHDALTAEIKRVAQDTRYTEPIKTIFIGGGTPSTYPPELLLDMSVTLNSVFKLDPNLEFSLEVNPGTVTQEKLETWKKVGITRLSVGVQSLNDTVLKGLNRHQSLADVLSFFDMAVPLFDNISVDLIVGLPGISSQEWKDSLMKIIQWPIKHVSLYFLTVHEDTPLYFGVKKNKYILPSDDTVVDLYNWSIETFAQAGLQQYEISNFAKPGYESKHNQVYWKRLPYRGFGLGACSFDGHVRFQNQKNLLKYCDDAYNGADVCVFKEELQPQDVWLERLMLGMRQMKGLPAVFFAEGADEELYKRRYAVLGELSQLGLIECAEYVTLTKSGRSVENEIVLKLSLV